MTGTQVVFLGGCSGVGKSTVAFALHELLSERDLSHAVIEGDNLDLAYPAPWAAHPSFLLAEKNLSAMWSNYRALGYRRLIFANTVSVLHIPELSAALGEKVEAVGILLRATSDAVHSRLAAREHGRALQQHVKRSAAAAVRLDADTPADVHRVETDGGNPQEIAARVLELTGWG
jgi:broad-specificity NMP kinase